MAYKAPIWEDGKSPAISAKNLNNLSQAAEGAQVLYGNSAPTSSTEGAVGQFYLVAVADSDGNYPLYQCVAIANGSYVWRDTRRIPDSITSMLGIPAPGTINGALNVLANVGNLHVWEMVQTYNEEVPAGYTLGDEINGFLYVRKMGSANKYYEMTIQYGSNIGVSDDGTVYISDVTSYTNYPGSTDMRDLLTKMAGKYFKIVKFTYPDYFTSYVDELVYIPATATITFDSNINMQTDYQVVTGTPAIPAGTTTDYLTSTDRNAYPDRSAEGGQDAYYSLGDVVSGNLIAVNSSSGTYVKVKHSSTLDVSEDGTISFPTTATTTEVMSTNSSNKDSDFGSFKGEFVQFSTDYGNVDIYISGIVFIPENATFSGANNVTVSYQPVTGHAAIPANTTITYLGQLGGGARIEVGSYVGTGTWGSSNKNSLTFGFVPKIIFVQGYENSSHFHAINGVKTSQGSKSYNTVFLWEDKTVSWYGQSNLSGQYNNPNEIYHYIAIG